MSYQHQQTQPPVMGATFIPGGFDDYYMPASQPEVVSPAPQRIMPEVPENMQDSLARLELDANASPRQTFAPQSALSGPPAQQPPPGTYGQQNQSMGYNQPQQGHRSQHSLSAPVTTHSRESSISSSVASPRAPSGSQQQQQQQQQQQFNSDYTKLATNQEVPNFSPFPKIPNRPSNVPPSDDERESTLENARLLVLNSNDPEMQLNWAQDALAYVDAAMGHEQRISETQPARSVTPAVEHQLRVDAMNVVSFLADQHHPKAEFLRGMWLEFGKFGLRVDKKEAFRCYTRAAEKGYARAEYRMGMQYESTNDPVSALIHYTKGADHGDSASLYRLGMMTLLGQYGQQQDYAKGLQLIRQAAASADENAPQGAYVLGMLLARELPQINVPEIFLPYNEKEARQNIERAAYLGFAKAQVKMGAAYELCMLGCDFNPALSLHYNALAARQGEAEADMAISKWFLCGYEGVFQKNEELAYTYALRAAQQALPTAEFAMGYFNEIGMHVPVNLEKALEWYDKAAKNGNKDAQSRIEGISKQSTLSKKDHETVAISKIRSQYGSRRGVRPDRFKSPPPPLPNIVETSPSEYSQDSAVTPSSTAQSLPSRLSSTTPYPLSDRPPVVPPAERPATVAPYPLDNGPPNSRPPPVAGFFAPDLRPTSLGPPPPQRPSSAFQINPNIYASEPANPPNGRLSGSGAPPLRPLNTQDGFPPRRDSRQPNGRFPAGGNPGGARPATVGPAPERHDNYPPASQPQLQPLDIGYTAPLEIRKQRPSGAGGPNVPEVGYQAPLDPKPAKARPQGLPANPSPGGRPTSRPNSAGRTSPNPSPKPPGAFPARKDSMPQVGHKPAKQPSAGPPPPVKTAPPKPQPAPPGKGPKTFDAMGIPQAKQENDCIIM